MRHLFHNFQHKEGAAQSVPSRLISARRRSLNSKTTSRDIRRDTPPSGRSVHSSPFYDCERRLPASLNEANNLLEFLHFLPGQRLNKLCDSLRELAFTLLDHASFRGSSSPPASSNLRARLYFFFSLPRHAIPPLVPSFVAYRRSDEYEQSGT